MKTRKKSRRYKKDKWGNRMALMGITVVVLSLAVVVNIKGSTLQTKDLEYQIKEDSLLARKTRELERASELEEKRIHVQTKQYIEQVAKEKLGLVKPDEILLKPSENQ